VIANNGILKLHVNGKEVSGVSECNPRKGYLALESEGSECRFKNLKIKELPSTNPKPAEVCDVDKGWKCMFTGLDLSGWKGDEEAKKHWKMSDGILSYDGKGAEKKMLLPVLSSEQSFRDFEFVLDHKSGPAVSLPSNVTIVLDNQYKGWNRTLIRVKGDKFRTIINGKEGPDTKMVNPTATPIVLHPAGDGRAPSQVRNVFIRELP